MTVITFSRQLGSHGDEIAAKVAQVLALRLVDAGTIDQAAQQAGVPSVALAEIEQEGEPGPIRQVLKAMRAMPALRSTAPFSAPLADETGTPYVDNTGMTLSFSGLFSPTAPPISASLDNYVRMVGMVVRGLAREGNVLIVGRGGQVLLRDQPQALHVQIVASLPYRVKVLMEEMGLERRAALGRIRASDRARADYMRRYHGASWLDPSLYHLVVNTERISEAATVRLIIAAHQSLQDEGHSV